MKKKVWILNHHANSMYFDEGGRHYNIAKYLKEKGYEPVIFCSNACHGNNKIYFEDLKLWQEHWAEKIQVPFIYVAGRPYVGNGKNRILCMLDYYKNVKKVAVEYAKRNGKPDIIIGSSVHPLAVLAAEQLARKFHVKCIAEFRDLWPESIVAMGIAKKTNPIVVALRMLEKKLYIDANAIVFTVPGGYDYITERKWDKQIAKDNVFYINNGVDLEAYMRNIEENVLVDKDLEDQNCFKVIYAGSIRRANGLTELVDGADILKNNGKLKFIIYGTGDYEKELKQKVQDNGQSNVVFKGKVEKKYIPYILSCSDLNILNYNAVAAAGFFRFGSSQNKLFEYFASGKPVLSNFQTNYDLIQEYKCGVSRELPNAQQYAEAIEEFINLDKRDYEQMCGNALRAAQDFDFKEHTNEYINIIEQV